MSPAWLADRMKEPDLRIIDGGWHMSAEPRTGRGDYQVEHLPGAVFFDIDAIADPATDLPHMLPTPEAFADAVGALGIGEGDRIVVYDHLGLFSAARVWWMFRAMGHGEVFVLDGGLARWKAEGRPVTAEVPTSTRQPFEARYDPALARDLGQVRAALAAGAQVLDARSAGRFTGAEPEPRAGLRSGHMPGALNLPWQTIVRDGALLPADELGEVLTAAGVRLDRPTITTCGSGVSACTLSLALAVLGRDDAAVYDGSWTEWGARSDTAVAAGP